MTRNEAEEFLLFCVMVANKPAVATRDKLRNLLSKVEGASPFNKIALMVEIGVLDHFLRAVRSGQYTRLGRALRGVLALDPLTCTLEQLEAIKGIGPKAARFFLLHTRPGLRAAALDTHVLKFLRKRGVPCVPKGTPAAGPTYRRLEKAFLDIADKEGKEPYELDLEVWNSYTKQRFLDNSVYLSGGVANASVAASGEDGRSRQTAGQGCAQTS